MTTAQNFKFKTLPIITIMSGVISSKVYQILLNKDLQHALKNFMDESFLAINEKHFTQSAVYTEIPSLQFNILNEVIFL